MLIRLGLKAVLLFMSLTLVACTSDKIVKTYGGKTLPEDALAVLTAPENITLLSVNGSEVQQYLLSNLEVKYGLKTGENLVVFKYESIWSKAKRDEETGSRVDVAESEPLAVRIIAKPGAKYSFSFLPADNLRDAKQLAASFEAQIIDEQKNLIAESVALHVLEKHEQQKLQKEQDLILQKQQNSDASMSIEDGATLEQLKAIWPRANADEKKAFLVWVFQK